MRRFLTTVIVAAALSVLPGLLHAQVQGARPAAAGEDAMKAMPATTLQWSAIQPEGFDPGVDIAVLDGDPATADQPYTIRLRFSDGYRFPAHYHPRAENLTVLSGTFQLGMGDMPSDNMQTYNPGDFIFMPPLKPHFGAVKGETIIQLHGIGPFDIKLAKPAGR